VVLLIHTGCLKDRGFESQEYGIQNPGSTSSKGIGFNLDAAASYVQTFSILSDNTSIQESDSSMTTIGLFSSGTAQSDIHVRVAFDPSVLTPADSNLVILNRSLYDFGTGDIVIKAGEKYASFSIKILNTTSLSLDTIYSIPLRIVSVDDPSLTIASNLDKILVKVVLKNKYDGLYYLNFTNYHPVYNPDYIGYDSVKVELRTITSNSVKLYWIADPDNPNMSSSFVPGYKCPSSLQGTLTNFGSQEPEYTIDPVTNEVTVANTSATASITYVMSPYTSPPVPSVYDPVTKKITAQWGYVTSAPREWTQEFIYIGPR
jgi:hypothetical protein